MGRKSSFALTDEEIAAIEAERAKARKERGVRYDRRLRAMLLLGRDGKTRKEVAEICEVEVRAVYAWLGAYRSGGLEALRLGRWKGRQRRLTAEQMERLAQLIRAGPEEAGYECGLWTGAMVTDLIQKEFAVKYSVPNVRRILHALGFSVQYPRRKLSKADKDAQEEWLQNTLPKVHRRAQDCGGAVLYEDEASFRQGGTISQTWAPVGEGTEVKTAPGRQSVKTFGAVSIESSPRWHFRFAEVFNALTFLVFLKGLLRCYPGRKVFLILDNVRYHWAQAVQDWVKENSDRIELHFLPPYSPELNASEYVWRTTRRKATHNCHFPTKDSLRKRLFRRFNRFQGNPACLRGTVKSFLPKAG
jgi:transposase